MLRTENCIRFLGKINPRAHGEFLACLQSCRRNGYQGLVLDFSTCESAYVNGMLPLLASVGALRSDRIELSVKLPQNPTLQRIFLKNNWAHFLEPARFEKSDMVHHRHLAVQRFGDFDEQHRLVNAFMDVVMRNIALERRVIAGLEWSINEITDNVLNHAECEEGGIAQVVTYGNDRKIAFGVADSGRGILASLREGHPDLQTDAEAVDEAMKAGITRNPDAGQGNGIAGALGIATRSGGKFSIISGQAQIMARVDPATSGPISEVYESKPSARFQGTVVYAELGLDTHFRLPDVLGFSGEPHDPGDIIETQFETESGDAVILRMRDESTGFGSRAAGEQLRNKCMNLLNAEPTKPLLLDWKGVPLVSSSFADELVGKLFASLGPLAFSARVKNLDMDGLVRGLVDKAIIQRAAQVARGTAFRRQDVREVSVEEQPSPQDPRTAIIERHLDRGRIAKALKQARSAGIVLKRDQIDSAARALFDSGSVGELLSLVGRIDVKLPFDTTTLLTRAFDKEDYHTFLKQVLRLGLEAEFTSEIRDAICMIRKRNEKEAGEWSQKFGYSIE